jgi:hypothetical protein
MGMICLLGFEVCAVGESPSRERTREGDAPAKKQLSARVVWTDLRDSFL